MTKLIPSMGMRNDFIYSCAIVALVTVAGLIGAYIEGAIGLVVFIVIAAIGFFGITRLADSPRVKEESGETGE